MVASGPSLTLGLWSLSLMSPAAVVQTQRAVGERSLSDRGARGAPPLRVRGDRVRVQRVVSPDGVESWTVIGSDLRPVDPVDKYLAWLSSIERAPTTVRAYAHDLKTFWEFVEARGIAWDAMSLEQLGAFTA